MGCKRPFEEMEFEELRFKHPRQLEYNNKSASFSELVSYNTSQDLFTIGKSEGGSCKFQRSETHVKENDVNIPLKAERDFVVSNSSSLATNGYDEEDICFGPFEGVAFEHRSSGYSEFGFPRRSFAPMQDPYSSSLNCPPRRLIPVGLDHQANIPIWRGKADEKKINQTEKLESNLVENCYEERLMGTCIISMPDFDNSILDGEEIGIGRSECFCLDSGSIRCVRQHVGSRRKKLKKSIGEINFEKLGFNEMGEEVSSEWSKEEELDFHEVVYSNPASLGRNFWSRLSAVFPSRSKKEIVSYYFNVFMLRKRAAQNRSRLLDIDSDDDEWHGINGGNSHVIRDSDDEEDSAIESLGDDQRPCEESEDDDNSDGSDDCDDGDFKAKDYGAVVDHSSKSLVPKSTIDECGFNHVDGISGRFPDDCVFQDDSCMSFECQANMSQSCGPVETENVKNSDRKSGGLVDHLYLSDSLDSKVWDARFNVSRPEKSLDLLPWDMIEDIFGDGKTKDE